MVQILSAIILALKFLPQLIAFIKDIRDGDASEVPVRTNNVFSELGQATDKDSQRKALANMQRTIKRS